MTKRAFLFGAVFALALSAQDAGLTESMRTIKRTMDELGQMEKKVGPKAISSGERLATRYEEMIQFWRQRDARDAVKISEEGKAAGSALASAAFAGNEEKAAEAIRTVGGTCKACHDARRERTPEGKFRIK